MSGVHKRYGSAGDDVPKRNNQIRFAAKVVANRNPYYTDQQAVKEVEEELRRTLEQREFAIAIRAYRGRIKDLTT